MPTMAAAGATTLFSTTKPPDGSDLLPCDHVFGTYRKDSSEIERVKPRLAAFNAGTPKAAAAAAAVVPGGQKKAA